MIRITLDNLWARKFRLLASSMAVLVGVAFMSGTLVLADTMGRSFDGLFTDAFDGVDVVVRAEPALAEDQFQFGGGSRPRFDDALIDTVATVDGVAAAGGEVEGFAQLIGADGEPIGDPMGAPQLGVVWPEIDQINPMVLVDGRAPDGVGEVVIDRGSSNAGELSVGDTTLVLTAAGPFEVTIVGVATWGDVDSPLGASITAWDLAAAQQVLAEPGRIDAISVVADGVSQSELRDLIAQVVPDGIEVITGADITEENQSAVREGLAFFNTFLLTFALIALFVGSFIIYNTFSILVAQRSREMALLRAVGASKGQVLGATLLEAAAIGLVASVVGLVAGVGVAGLLKGLFALIGLEVPAGGTVVSGGTVVAAFVAGLGVTLSAAIIPARRAARIPPVAALSAAAVEAPAKSVLRSVAGVAVTALGVALLAAGLFAEVDNAVAIVGAGALVTFVGVAVIGPLLARPAARLLGAPLARWRGVAGKLARQNAMRNPRRTASTAAALMIGVALVAFITIIAESTRASVREAIGESFRGDIVVNSGSFGFGGFGPDLNEQIAGVDGVAATSPLRVAPAEVDGTASVLVGVDPTALEQIFDIGVESGGLAGFDERSIAVHRDAAETAAVGVGDTLEVRFVEGGLQQMTVGAVFSNRDLVGSDHVVGTSAFDAYAPGQGDLLVLVDLDDTADLADVTGQIEAAAASYPNASVLDQTEFADQQAASFDPILGLVYVLLALSVLVALLGIANTLALSIHERTRELGLLRAVGMTRRQLRSSIRWEAVIIAVFGSLLGLLIGLFFGRVMVTALADEGFSQFRAPLLQLLVITLLATLAGVVAAALPARRAARLDVLDALESE